MSIIEKRNDGGNLKGDYFKHTKTGKEFRRIVGGFAWAEKKPGFVVAVGEELEPDPTTKRRHLWVVGETEDFNIQNLFRRGVEFREIYKVEVFCGNTRKQAMMSHLHQFNRSSGNPTLSGLPLREAPYLDDEDSFFSYLQDIVELIDPVSKYLHFIETSKLPELLLKATNPKETPSPDAQSFPGIVALGSAVSYLKIYQPQFLPPIKPPQQNLAKSYAVNLDFRKRRPIY